MWPSVCFYKGEVVYRRIGGCLGSAHSVQICKFIYHPVSICGVYKKTKQVLTFNATEHRQTVVKV